MCSNPCCGRGHGMVSTTAQTMALCNEKMVQDVMYGQNCFLTKKIFKHSRSQSNSFCRTWCYRIKQFLISIDHEHIFRAEDLNARLVLPIIDANLKIFYEKCWQEKLQDEFAVRGEAHGGNKLRTYRTFKNTYITEPYVHIITQKKFRSAYAKFRCVSHLLTLHYVDMA